MSIGPLDREQVGNVLDALDFAIDEMEYTYFDERNPWRAWLDEPDFEAFEKQFREWKEVREIVAAMYNEVEPRTEKESQCPQA